MVHESGHLILGRIFGGGTAIGEYFYGLPSKTVFRSPQNMTNWQVRLTGGFVLIFPLILFFGAYFRVGYLIFFAAGGSAISHTDLIATYSPEAWRKLASGGEITAEDL
jgi:hypothetical protein